MDIVNIATKEKLIEQTIVELNALKDELAHTSNKYKRKIVRLEIRNVAAQLAFLMTA